MRCFQQDVPTILIFNLLNHFSCLSIPCNPKCLSMTSTMTEPLYLSSIRLCFVWEQVPRELNKPFPVFWMALTTTIYMQSCASVLPNTRLQETEAHMHSLSSVLGTIFFNMCTVSSGQGSLLSRLKYGTELRISLNSEWRLKYSLICQLVLFSLLGPAILCDI